MIYSLTFRHHTRSIFRTGLFSNQYLIGAIALGFALQLLVMGIPVMQKAFKLQMLDSQGWVYVIGMGLVPLLFNEIFKWVDRLIHKRKNKPELTDRDRS